MNLNYFPFDNISLDGKITQEAEDVNLKENQSQALDT